jgi:hypothetical protein
MPPAPPKYGGATSTAVRDGANVFPPSCDLGEGSSAAVIPNGDYYVPATGYSYLDLYLMGLVSPAEVPDFFLLKNLVPAGKDATGHPFFKADRTKVRIQDVIAAEGHREPDVDHSQRKFNTGMVLIVEHGRKPSDVLIERAIGIAKQWIDYWDRSTGHRATMTVHPQ